MVMNQLKKVLVCEDEFIIADDLRSCLQEFGYQVVGIEANGPDAIRRVGEERPHLVMMDIMLQGEMDGIEAAQEIFKLYRTRVIYLTSYSDEKTLERAKLTEPLGYLSKPFDQKELRITMEMAFYKAETDRKLLETKNLLSLLLNNVGDAVIATDLSGKIVFLNTLAQRISGLEEEEAIGKDLSDLITLREREDQKIRPFPFRSVIECGVKCGPDIHLFQGKRPQQYIIENNWSPIRDGDDNITGAIWAFRDVTQREEALKDRSKIEAKMQQVQRLDGLGLLAGGIVHDFNNIMTIIFSQAHVAQIRLKNKDSVENNIKGILDAAKKADELIKQLLTYTSEGSARPHMVTIPILMDEMIHLLRFPPEIVVTRDYESETPPILADVTKIRQVILNLLTNAFEAIKEENPPERAMSVKTGVLHADRKYLDELQLGNGLSEGTYVYLEVGDNGIGMDQETQKKIFDLFFTTKTTGHGLGMAAVMGIVRDMKGAIRIEAKPHAGARVRVLFPCNAN